MTPFETEIQSSNNPTGWKELEKLFDEFRNLYTAELIPGLYTVVRTAEKATAILYLAILTTKKYQIDLKFNSLVNDARGGSYGAKLINFAIAKSDIEVAADLKLAWSGIHADMAATLGMLINEGKFETFTNLSPEHIVSWIKDRGGLVAIKMQYLTHMREGKRQQAAQEELDRILGQNLRKQREAKLAGFETIEDHEKHLFLIKESARKAELTSKFNSLKADLIARGKELTKKDLSSPPEEKLLITSQGKFYLINPEDEFALLSCAAAIK